MIKVLVAQRPCFADPDMALGDAEATLLHARIVGADLVVFPECFLTGYGHLDNAIGADDPILRRAAAACSAAKVSAVFGFTEQPPGDTGHLHISAVWIDQEGQVLSRYRKSHLWLPSAFESSRGMAPGHHESMIVDLKGVRCAVLICFDIELVEPARCLALQGADLIVVIGANSAEFTMTHIVPTRAFENGLHVLYANLCSANPHEFCGLSVVCSPTGGVLASAPPGPHRADVVAQIIPQKEEFVKCRQRNPFFTVRQPQLYKAIVGGE
jgi:predicted amidohydrolase